MAHRQRNRGCSPKGRGGDWRWRRNKAADWCRKSRAVAMMTTGGEGPSPALRLSKGRVTCYASGIFLPADRAAGAHGGGSRPKAGGRASSSPGGATSRGRRPRTGGRQPPRSGF